MERQLKIGSEIWLKLPYGDLFQQVHDKKNTVFIAGGTGITPFLSLFSHTLFEEYTDPKIYLGFRSVDFNIYIEELKEIKNTSKTVQSVYENETGLLDIETIFNANGTASDYFISGPPVMIKSFKNKLVDFGVPANKVLTDDWE